MDGNKPMTPNQIDTVSTIIAQKLDYERSKTNIAFKKALPSQYKSMNAITQLKSNLQQIMTMNKSLPMTLIVKSTVSLLSQNAYLDT